MQQEDILSMPWRGLNHFRCLKVGVSLGGSGYACPQHCWWVPTPGASTWGSFAAMELQVAGYSLLSLTCSVNNEAMVFCEDGLWGFNMLEASCPSW
jgi:hypothetical protein